MTKQEAALQLTLKLLENKDVLGDIEHQIIAIGNNESNYNSLRAKEVASIYNEILKSLG